MDSSDNKHTALRALPSVDALLKTETACRLAGEIGGAALTLLARRATENLRQQMLQTTFENGNGRAELLMKAEALLLELHQTQIATGIRRVINATGVILHTNLGRAPLSQAAR